MGPLSYIESASFIFLCRAGFEPGLIIIGKWGEISPWTVFSYDSCDPGMFGTHWDHVEIKDASKLTLKLMYVF